MMHHYYNIASNVMLTIHMQGYLQSNLTKDAEDREESQLREIEDYQRILKLKYKVITRLLHERHLPNLEGPSKDFQNFNF
jgi:hypothetical protein